MRTMTLPNGSMVAYLNHQNTLDLYDELFVHDVYGKTGAQIKDGDLIFDVGANIGLFSLWARLQAPECQLVCFEPSPATCEVLRANAVADIIYQAAVSDHCGEIDLTFYPYLPELSTVLPEDFSAEERNDWTEYLRRRVAEHPLGRWFPPLLRKITAELFRRWMFQSRSVSVHCITLQSVMDGLMGDRRHIDLLKIDVEKSELKVLQGIGDGWGRIRQIIVESYGDPRLVEPIDSLLRSKGFNLTWYDNTMFPELKTPLVFGRKP